MKYFLSILLIFCFFISKAQTYPPSSGSGSVPSSKTYWYQGDVIQGVNGLFVSIKDTNWTPRFAGAVTLWQHTGVDTLLWQYDGLKWNKVGSGSGGGNTWDASLIAQGSTPMSGDYTVDWNGQSFYQQNLGEYQVIAGAGRGSPNSQLFISSGTSATLSSTDGGSNTSTFNVNEDGTITSTSTSFTEFASGAGSILDLNPNGTFAFQSSTGTYQFSNLNTLTSPTQVATFDGSGNLKQTLASDLIPGFGTDTINFYVLDSLNTPPVSPSTGDVYEVGTVPTGAWSGHAGDIATWGGSSWSFQTPTTGNQLLNDATSIVSKWTGSVWLRVSRYAWFAGGNAGIPNGKLGTTNGALRIITNNVARISIAASGAITFNSAYTFPTSDGTSNQVLTTNGSGVVTWQSVTGAQTFQQTLTTGSTLTTNNTVTGSGLNFTWNLKEWTVNASDSILAAATNKISLSAGDTLKGLSSTVNYFRAPVANLSATTRLFVGTYTGSSDSVGFRMQNTQIIGKGIAAGAQTDSILSINTTTGVIGRIAISAGSSYTFSTGLTNTSSTITANISTGVSGGQTIIGGTGSGDGLIIKATTANGTSTATALTFEGGNNGGTVFGTIKNSGTQSWALGTIVDGTAGYAMTGTLPSSTTGANNGYSLTITSAGSSANVQRGLLVSLASGFTGAASTVGASFSNAAAGTVKAIIDGTGNSGIYSQANATTTGANLGVYGNASGGDRNAGVAGVSYTAKNSASNVGVFGAALNTGTSGVQVGGYFFLGGSEPNPAFTTSSALIADNGTVAQNIFTAMDNTSAVFTIADGGAMTGTVSLTIPNVYGSTSSSGTLTLNSTSNGSKGKILFGSSGAYDEANGRLGIGTQSPSIAVQAVGSSGAPTLPSFGAADVFAVTNNSNANLVWVTGTNNIAQIKIYNTSTFTGSLAYDNSLNQWRIGTSGTNAFSTSDILIGSNHFVGIGTGSTDATSGLQVNTSFASAYVSKAVDYTLTSSDGTVEVTATGHTYTLPTAVGCTGRIYRIKLTAVGSATVNTTSSQNIDGSTTYSLSAQYKYVVVQSNNVGWVIIANN